MDLDLTEAQLHRFDLARCQVRDAQFRGAYFAGDAKFDEAQFSGNATFDKAYFAGDAKFDEVRFSGNAWFDEAYFAGDAKFDEARFSGYAWFDKAHFSRGVTFSGVTFPAPPVSIYLKDGRESTVRDARSALRAVADEVGLNLIAESDPVYGSFWQKFRAKASDPHTQEEVYNRLIKLERSAEVRLLAVPESQANMQNAQGLAAIIESLKGESAAVVQLGPLVVVKAPTPGLGSAILCRTLTAKELRMLESRPDLLSDPCGLIERLTAAGQDGQIQDGQIEQGR